MKQDTQMKFIYTKNEKFCADYSQHNIIHGYDYESILGDFYYCSFCDHIQVG